MQNFELEIGKIKNCLEKFATLGFVQFDENEYCLYLILEKFAKTVHGCGIGYFSIFRTFIRFDERKAMKKSKLLPHIKYKKKFECLRIAA